MIQNFYLGKKWRISVLIYISFNDISIKIKIVSTGILH